MNHFEEFVRDLNNEISDQVISVVEFGSGKGEKHPLLSDIDLLVVCKDKTNIPQLVAKIRAIEKKTLKTSHSELTDLLEESLFASDDFTGVHLIIFCEKEFYPNWKPKSLRMKFVTTFLISEPILLYHLQTESKLLIGRNLVDNVKEFKLSLSDKFSTLCPYFILWTLIPLMSKNRLQFKIWCFKLLKYHSDSLVAYSRIKKHDPAITIDTLVNNNLLLQAPEYRYHPNSYHHPLAFLYFQTLACLFKEILVVSKI